ncbi:LOW QUALITY PROTEIN: ornithine decarboxylase antizyme 2 [Notechis scutatus]|uniref:LOW QUALITY PROTEIN: ornithine decarboxylase antizyme 2 n=1 Tax=Notechis scutatus TaxID=8663 RepID=A0A6J1VB14_9SAUR|nr:LOW QUALITY PROTEIN: ornithine decarboxylase antizyme 2 [Notechis scutatus]
MGEVIPSLQRPGNQIISCKAVLSLIPWLTHKDVRAPEFRWNLAGGFVALTFVLSFSSRSILPLSNCPQVPCCRHIVPGPLWCSDAPHPLSKIPGGRGVGRDPSLSALIYKDEKLTVNQDLPVHDGKPHIVHFQYKVTEVKVSSWDAVLSNQSLFVEIPDGLLADGSKEG